MEIDHQLRVVIPGDIIEEATESNITLGPGLRQDGEHIVATKAGVLRHLPPNKWWIESNQKRVQTSWTFFFNIMKTKAKASMSLPLANPCWARLLVD